MTCCAKRPLVMVYVAVLSYFSVAFMGLATLPAYLQGVVIRDNPGASTEQVAAIYGNRFLVFTLLQGSLSVLVAGWAGRLSDRFGRRRCASLPAIGQAVVSAVTLHPEGCKSLGGNLGNLGLEWKDNVVQDASTAERLR